MRIKQTTSRSVLFITALLVALPLSLFINQFASAADPTTRSTQDQAKLYTYYTALRGCANKSLKDVISTDSSNVAATDPSNWFNDEVTTYVYPSGTSSLKCQDIMKGIATTWGSPDYGRFLESAGYRLDRSKPEYKWSNGDENARRDAFMSAILQKSPGIDQLTDAAKYELYLSSLFGDCKAEDKGLYTSLFNTSFPSWADNSQKEGDYVYKKIKMADGDHVIKRLSGGNMIIYGWQAFSAFTGEKDATCQSISDTVSQTADAYAFEQSKIACMTSGPKYTKANLIDACATGATNRTSAIDFCLAKYPGVFSGGQGSTQQEEKAACFVGQDNGGGGDCVDAGYTDKATLQACVNGSKNKGNANYCDTQYTAPDNLKPGQSIDPRAAERAACKVGASPQVSVPGITQPSLENKSCSINPNAAGCKGGGDKASCGSIVTSIGWLLCPVVDALGGLNDAMWGLVSALLTVSPIQSGDPASVIWGTFRNFANVLLVVVFLIIIYAQLTGMGISNYGIKKMLPKLVVVAILINLSFFIVQISVDIANILGKSIYDLLNGVGDATRQVPTWGALINLITVTGTGALTVVAGIALLGGAKAAFFIILPGAIVAVLGFLAAMVVLIFRQAIIPILAVLAPLALVAYILPNTQQWFNKWRSMFVSMLMLFPTAALLFGGVKLSAIMIIGDGSDWWRMLIGLIMLGAPLFMLPFIAKQGGPILSKLAGSVSSLAGKARSPISKWSGSGADRAKAEYMAKPASRFNIGRRIRQGSERSNRLRGLETAAYKAQSEADFSRDVAQNADIYASRMPDGSVAQSYIRGAAARAEAEELKSALQPLIRELAQERAAGNDTDAFLETRAVSATHTAAERAAAMHQLATTGRDNALRRLATPGSGADQTVLQEAIGAGGGALVGKAPDIVKGAGPAFNTVNGEQLAKFSAGTAAAHMQHLEKLYTQATAPGASIKDRETFDTAIQSFNSAVEDITHDSLLQASFGGDTGKSIQREIASSTSAAFQAYVNSNMTGLAAIQNDGKIR